jgi:hypothetical protein
LSRYGCDPPHRATVLTSVGSRADIRTGGPRDPLTNVVDGSAG